MESLHSLFYFIIAIAILVTFHEFGHFWVARKMGVKVLCFSVGFGKKLLIRQKSPTDTEFVISAIPLGGYVKMVDEREGQVAAEDLPFAFNRQSLWARTAIVAAGPVFNLLLAVILFWTVLVLGEDGIRPIVGSIEAGTLAEQAGFNERDEILSINQKLTPTWMDTLDTLYSLAISGEHELAVAVKTVDGDQRIHVLAISDEDVQNPETLQNKLGLKPWMPIIKPIIGKLLEEGVAKQAGLQTGDLLLSADEIPLKDWQQWVDYVQARPDTAINLLIERNDRQLQLTITPRKEEVKGKAVGKIGAGVDVPKDLLDSLRVTHSLSPWEAVPTAFEKTGFYMLSTLKMMGKMFVGAASVQNLSGPISIAQYAGQSADMGMTAFLKFLGLVSVSLGVLNLLPIPVLDGGHLLFFALEAVKGSPVSEKIQMVFQQLGMFLLLSLMLFAMYLDIGKLFQS
ncbi:RIP metalloprotease RseP [Methylomonas sp. AM2-LC]|uniref:RIP metalloprotease RseP n=1 Tax=Methylomonas sp. AM2-LC TaxID=3153301 RepID=UPI003267CFED